MASKKQGRSNKRAGAKPPQSTQPPQPTRSRLRARKRRGPTKRGQIDHFDPRHPALIPGVVSEGHAFPITGSVARNLTVDTTSRLLFVFTNNGSSGTAMGYVYANDATNKEVFTIPLLAAADNAGGPTSGRAMKGGLTICNRTQQLKTGGQVTVLNASQRVALPASPATMTKDQWSSFMDTVVSHPQSRIYNGGDFSRSKTYITHPLDQTEYLKYTPWHGTLTFTEFWNHVAVWPSSEPDIRPMSTVFVVFESAPENNSYEFKGRSSFYTRWPLESVPGQAQRPVPTAPASVVNAMRDHAESTSHLPRGEELALAGVTGAAAMSGATWLKNAMTGLRMGAAVVGEGMELAAPYLPLLAAA